MNSPRFEFHVSRFARNKYGFEEILFSWTGNVLFADLAASRNFAEKMNRVRDAAKNPELVINPGSLNAMGIIDEVLHAVLEMYRRERDPRAMEDALAWFEARLGRRAVDETLHAFTADFPNADIYSGRQTVEGWLSGSTAGMSHRAVALEEMIMLWLANANPAFVRYTELFDDTALSSGTSYAEITTAIKDYFETRPKYGPDNQNLIDMLRAPALASPDSLEGQLAYIREKWSGVLGDMVRRILLALDIYKEEELAIWMRFHPMAPRIGGKGLEGDSSAAAIPHFSAAEPEYERFSPDLDWMPRTVMIAKSVFVWLDQLSKQYQRHIHRLDQVPDEELDSMARRGFNALWLIGLWERSRASQRIKQLTGNPEAAASAYSLFDYQVANDLGGDEAFLRLKDRATARGIRMGSDMVPNHMGIDSRWVIEHPEWFLSVPYTPYPAYTFDGPDVSSDGRVEIKIEDHYYNRTDAAVVFRRHDRWSGDTRFIYHGNDGTSFPWNDTAQLDYLNPAVREAVMQNILHVARLSPIIRFDAAMTLTKQHYQRLWFPQPGSGGGIPSRAEHGLTKPEFDRAMPSEFWRDVVDRVSAEVPGTLLLAEAFWLLEGYFVRTLGMHRVYNSAFMNMLRDEENANYRSVIKNTIEFDPDILKRYVNFMNNPDERTAVDQFGKGDKYFGVCTLMATLPGLPMFGHGQIEGYTERYGMEYRRAYHDETPDQWLVARHEREISPLLHRRPLFAEVQNFLLYDFFTDAGHVNEDVFAYSNRLGDQRALVVFHNRYSDTQGWVRMSCSYAEKRPDGSKGVRQRSLGEALGFPYDGGTYLAVRDSVTGLEYLYSSRSLHDQGLRIELGAYQYRVLLDWREVHDRVGEPWGELCGVLGGRGVSSLAEAIRGLQLKPVFDAMREVLDPGVVTSLATLARAKDPEEFSAVVDSVGHRIRVFLERSRQLSAIDRQGAKQEEEWLGEVDLAVEGAIRRIHAACRVPSLQKQFAHPWPVEAREVMPCGGTAPDVKPWAATLAWAVLLALGEFRDPADPSRAAFSLFESQRLREPLAQSLERSGYEGEDRWKAAARVRALLAHEPWAPGSEQTTVNAPFSWLHDPDIAWLIGVHQHEGIRYFSKEEYERLLWWMALPALVRASEEKEVNLESLREVEEQIESRMEAAAEAGYQVEVLLAPAESRTRK